MTDPRMTPTNDAPVTVEPLALRLVIAQIASCSCGTKTHEARYHDQRCLYRVLQDAQTEIDQLTVLNDKYFWQVRDTCTRAEKAEAALASAPAGDGDMLPCPNPWCDSESPPFMHRIVSHREEWAVSCGCGFLGPILDSPERAEAAWNSRRGAVAPAGDGGGADEDAALLADANSWYSQAQLEEIESADDDWLTAYQLLAKATGLNADRHVTANDRLMDRDTVSTEHALEAVEAALARPRAAVGEREAEEVRRIVRWIDQAIERAENHRNTEGIWLFASQWQTVRDILALQSPPATEAV